MPLNARAFVHVHVPSRFPRNVNSAPIPRLCFILYLTPSVCSTLISMLRMLRKLGHRLQHRVGISLPTNSRPSFGWCPTKVSSAEMIMLARYVAAMPRRKTHPSGTGPCAMLVSAADSEVLRNHEALVFQVGPYGYQLLTQGAKNI